MMIESVEISVIIKCLNEERNIEACIDSCFRELVGYSSEIILIDSLSTDQTVARASNYPISIYQFENGADVGCGSAVELGYQRAKGQFILLVDGDMVLEPGFIEAAMKHLLKNSKLAGVSGVLVDSNKSNFSGQKRSEIYSRIKSPKVVDCLGGGGIYRAEAIKKVGYLANSSFLACEELDLGIRLASVGYVLERGPYPFVKHSGHLESSFDMLKRLWKNGRLSAYSVFLKASIGKKWFCKALQKCWFVLVVPMSIVLCLVHLLVFQSFALTASSFSLFWVIVFFIQVLRKRSFTAGWWSIAFWWALFLAIPRALTITTRDPLRDLRFKKLK